MKTDATLRILVALYCGAGCSPKEAEVALRRQAVEDSVWRAPYAGTILWRSADDVLQRAPRARSSAWRPLRAVHIGGLLLAPVLTLLVLPVLYSLFCEKFKVIK